MNYEFLDDIKEKILKDINSISAFSKNIAESISFTLNDIYKLFNYSQRFDELINEFQNINWEEVDEKVAENFIKSMSFIFDVTKKSDPISYVVFYSMQYTFWPIIVVGGILTNMKLSARLLNNSLSLFGKQPSDILIEDDETITTILDSESFRDRINQLLKKYGEGKEGFIVDNNAPTFKSLKEYADSNKSKFTDILSTTLNNFGVVSSKYGVIKTYNIKIKFETKEGEF